MKASPLPRRLRRAAEAVRRSRVLLTPLGYGRSSGLSHSAACVNLRDAAAEGLIARHEGARGQVAYGRVGSPFPAALRSPPARAAAFLRSVGPSGATAEAAAEAWGLTRSRAYVILSEARDAGLAVMRGSTCSARWYAPGEAPDRAPAVALRLAREAGPAGVSSVEVHPRIGCCQKTAAKVLSDLAEHGLLVRVRARRGNGSRYLAREAAGA